MKMLAAVVVLFVVASVSDGVILNKCEVKKELEAVLHPNATHILAQMMCHIQMTSKFNTSAINTIHDPERHGSRERRAARSVGKTTVQPSKIKPSIPTKKPEEANEVWTMYGLFQLSDHVACNATHATQHSLNLCGLNCSKLLDDDITDDLACVKVLIGKKTAGSDHETVEIIQKMISLLEPHCVNAVSSQINCP